MYSKWLPEKFFRADCWKRLYVTLIRSLFAIDKTANGHYTTITVLGLRFKRRRKFHLQKVLCSRMELMDANFKITRDLISGLEERIRDCHGALENASNQHIQENYRYHINNLKQKSCIKIAFLVWENAKWNGEDLYKKFLAHKHFSPLILLAHDEDDDSNYHFFKSRGYEVHKLDVAYDIWQYHVDVIFYQQPWFALQGEYAPSQLSKYGLCLYYPYAISTTIERPITWFICRQFFKNMYAHFVFNEHIAEQFKNLGIDNVIPLGHPKLDAYLHDVSQSPWKNDEKIKVIYAPHHSFSVDSLQWATFRWNGQAMLQLAKNSPHTEWIFKPHPLFKYTLLINHIMTEQEIEDYYQEWASIGQVYDQGDYFDIFRTSNMLITDCGSFLTEYLPTKNPVMHLVQSDEQMFSLLERFSSQHYYKVHDLDELTATFDMLVNRGEDPLRSQREQDASAITFHASDNILNYVCRLLDKES